jgi:hypothetical protein
LKINDASHDHQIDVGITIAIFSMRYVRGEVSDVTRWMVMEGNVSNQKAQQNCKDDGSKLNNFHFNI